MRSPLASAWSFAVTAHVQKVWAFGVQLDWDSEMGSAAAETFFYERDLTGDVVGETKLQHASIGPLRTSSSTLGALGGQKLLEWDLDGFEVIDASGSLQLAHEQ